MNGWRGKILVIDLSSRKYFEERVDPDIYKNFIGGKGLAGYFLKKWIKHDFSDPRMPILFFSGPLVDTPSPTSGRMTVMSRSPLTGTIGDASCGGNFGSFIKKAGYDGIIIYGKSDKVCGIEISDGSVSFSDASPLTGLKVSEIHSKLKEKGSTATTGPAAENGVLFSSIVVDGHYFVGRNGLGLVFSSKNLKYITVKGTGKTSVYDKDLLKKAREDVFRLTSASPILMGELGISNYGTGALYDLMSARRMMPTDNFKKTFFNNSLSMNANSYKQKYKPKKTGCRGCHILCKKITKDGLIMPEFETMSHFSALLGNDDISCVTQANKICNEMGMDTITAGATLACYSEIQDRKIDPKEILSLLNDIGLGRGEGRELSLGSYRYAEKHGKPEACMAVKKLELPAYDPRGALGMALAYATSTRGGCHLRAYPISHEILRKPVSTDRFSFSGKARIIKIAEDLNAIVDSLTACKFIFLGVTLEEFAKVFTAVTGTHITAHELLKVGERIYYNERMMNSLNGFDRKDDVLPERFFKELGSAGNNIDVPNIKKKEFEETLDKYYKVRGLDSNGNPTKEKAEELGLTWLS